MPCRATSAAVREHFGRGDAEAALREGGFSSNGPGGELAVDREARENDRSVASRSTERSETEVARSIGTLPSCRGARGAPSRRWRPPRPRLPPYPRRRRGCCRRSLVRRRPANNHHGHVNHIVHSLWVNQSSTVHGTSSYV